MRPLAWGARAWPLALAVAALPVLATVPELVLTITEELAQPAHAWKPFDAYPVKLYDIDGDGRKEIIDHNDNRYVYVLDSATGELLAEITTAFPQGWGARTINGVEVERVCGCPPSLIVANSAAYVTRFDYNASQSNATHFHFDKKWERRVNDFTPNAGMDAKPVLIDANRNGFFEIHVQVEEVGLFALKYDGGILWKKNVSGGNAEPVVADWDRDGHLETLFFSDDGWVRVYDSLTGAFEWNYDAKQKIGAPGSIPRGGTVADIDNGGRWEVVFGARDAHDTQNLSNNHMGIFVLHNRDMDGQGNLLWFRQPGWAAPLWYTRFVVYDQNANGHKEIYGMDWNTMGQNPGNWERTGPAHAFSFNRWGSEVWNTTLDTWWSNKDIAVADVDGDGKRELLASGPDEEGHDGWWALRLGNGSQLQHLDVWPWKSSRGPRLGDLDKDGDLDMVLPVEGDSNGTTPGEGAFQVWALNTSVATLVWSGGEDGYASPAPFTATFHPHNDSNEFYVKVKIRSLHHVVKAWFNEDGGAWQELDHLQTAPDWTLWDKATNVPEGTTVRFKARDDLGKELVSGPFTWPP